ncbi:MAG: glutathione S-transferase family protein [Gammaproteobacteria bacterium]|nr:glutathione S-transferase family protein [Gammaproteobacteria bacterium]
MAEIILHHYALSPFSEKIRRILAYKKIPWRAVEQPVIAPKPDLTPLTGGYRRIPVMQIGADIYCDTALMVQMIESRYPEPACVPTEEAGVVALLEDWADHRLFMQVVPPVIVELLPALPPNFIADRSAMSAGFTQEAFVGAAPHALAQTKQSLTRLEAQLTNQSFLLGANFTVADAACFHCVWFLKNSPRVWVEVTRRPALAAWVARIEAFGPGKMQPMTGAEALTIARNAQPGDLSGGDSADAEFAIGDNVAIVADDYGKERTTGRVARLAANQITVLREDPAVGEIAVHYPRAGYRIAKI